MQGLFGKVLFNCNSRILDCDSILQNDYSLVNQIFVDSFCDNNSILIGVRTPIDNKKSFVSQSNNAKYCVAFYGSIYNFEELSEYLKKYDSSFFANNNAELISKLFQQKGSDCLKMIDGMFVVAVYDKQIKNLILARDRMGGKPLYYYTNSDCFVFGSSLNDVRNLSPTSKRISMPALSFYFQYTYIPAPLSIFEDIYKLMPGHFINISHDGIIDDECYWKLMKDNTFASLSYEEAKEELYSRLNDSVRQRMKTNGKVGAFLSGGLDSGTIAALMAKNSAQPIRTFTIGKNVSNDESSRAAIMAQYIGSEHTCFVVDYQDGIKAANEIIGKMEEPFADSSSIPEYIVSKLASESVDTVLTGDAGDELLLGYNKYLINYYADRYIKIPKFIRKSILEPLFSVMPDKTYLTLKIGKVIKAAEKDHFGRHNSMMQLGFKDDEIRQVLADGIYCDSVQNLVREYYEDGVGTFLDKAQYSDLHVVMEGDMLTKVDRMCTLNSLDARAPMLSNDFVEFAYSLPAEYKLQGKRTKRIMRDTFVSLFPKGYDKFPKSGFGIPVGTWFRAEMKEELLDLLSADNLRNQGILNSDYINTIIEEHMSGNVNRASELWSLFVFEKWVNKTKQR